MRKALTVTKLFIPLILVVATAPGAPVLAQTGEGQAEPVCTAPAAPPAELAGWPAPESVKAAASIEASDAALLAPGKAADLALLPTPDVKFAIRPEHPGGSVSSSGIAAIRIDRAGIYRVAIDSAAWLDVVADGKSLPSVNHGRGPACTGIRKMVDFGLDPGRYLLQIAGNGTPKIRVLIAALPGA